VAPSSAMMDEEKISVYLSNELASAASPENSASANDICRVSRVGIEPTTLGLKGRTALSDGVARIRKLSPPLDKFQAAIPPLIKIWHRLRSRLLTGC
jgi:hypothetical protein